MSSDAAATIAGRCPRAVAGFLLLAVLVLAADLITKTLAFRHVADQPIALSAENGSADIIPPHEAVVLVPKLLSLKLTLNRGAAFGLGQGGRWVFVVVAVAAVAVIVSRIFWRSRRGDRLLHVALALLLGGAMGNLYDRLAVRRRAGHVLALPRSPTCPSAGAGPAAATTSIRGSSTWPTPPCAWRWRLMLAPHVRSHRQRRKRSHHVRRFHLGALRRRPFQSLPFDGSIMSTTTVTPPTSFPPTSTRPAGSISSRSTRLLQERAVDSVDGLEQLLLDRSELDAAASEGRTRTSTSR